MGLKICKYCLDSVETTSEGNSFYVCGKCFKKLKKENTAYSNTLIINLNKFIHSIDKKMKQVSTTKHKDYMIILSKSLKLKREIQIKLDEGKL